MNYLQSAKGDGSIKGVAFWQWFEQGEVAPAAEGFGTGLYGITTDDPAFQRIKSNAQVGASLSTGDVILALVQSHAQKK